MHETQTILTQYWRWNGKHKKANSTYSGR